MSYKSLAAIIAVAFAFVLTLLALGAVTPAGAGDANTLRVVKVVDGPVPPGAVFSIEVTCSSTAGSPGAEAIVPVTLQFDETGAPIGADSLTVVDFSDCTVTETEANGASVSYACVIDGGPQPVDAWCPDDQTVSLGDVTGAVGTVTVTNTFEGDPPPPPPPPPPTVDEDEVTNDPEVVAEVVSATPTFAG